MEEMTSKSIYVPSNQLQRRPNAGQTSPAQTHMREAGSVHDGVMNAKSVWDSKPPTVVFVSLQSVSYLMLVFLSMCTLSFMFFSGFVTA
jgi:hypothetical protein